MMKTGFIFYNNGMTLTVLCFHGNEKLNVALLVSSDGMFITVRNVSPAPKGTYSWAWGHYFTSIQDAVSDFNERVKMLD